MKKRAIWAGVLIVLVGAAAGGWWFAERQWPRVNNTPGLLAFGYIEAEEVPVATELGGRILALSAGEGDAVATGQVLVRLDDSLFQAHEQVAMADLARAQAILAQVEADARPEALNYAKAVVNQTRTGQAAALVAWQDAQAMLENPQELELAIIAARAQLGVLDMQVRQARAVANAGQAVRDLADATIGMLEDFEPQVLRFGPNVIRIKIPSDALPKARHEQAIATYQSWSAWAGLAQAQAARTGVENQVAQQEQ